MSLNNITTASITNKKVVEVKDKKIKLTLSKRVLNQIIVAHKMVGDIEWSGYLLFKETNGSLESNNLELYGDYIHIMDVGTSGYTDFKVDEAVIEMYDEFPDAMDYQIAAVHTHHSMTCFFSGTDMQELQDNTDKYPYYLSLIVNHKGQYCAKVAWIAKTEEKVFNSKFFKWKQPAEEVLCTVNCDIEFETDFILVDRLNKLIEAKSKKWSNSIGALASQARDFGYGRTFSDRKMYGGESFTLDDYYNLRSGESEDKQLSMFDKPVIHHDGDDKPRSFSVQEVNDFTVALLLQDATEHTTIGDAVSRVIQKIGKNDAKIDMWLQSIADSFYDIYDDIFDEDNASLTDYETISRKVANALEKYSFNPCIDYLLDYLKTPIPIE